MTRDLVIRVKGYQNKYSGHVGHNLAYMTIEIHSTRLPEACGVMQTIKHKYVLKIYKKKSLLLSHL